MPSENVAMATIFAWNFRKDREVILDLHEGIMKVWHEFTVSISPFNIVDGGQLERHWMVASLCQTIGQHPDYTKLS